MMDYEEFKQEIMDNIKDYLPEEYADARVEMRDIVKNNDQHLDGLTVVLADSNIAPTIYVNQFYQDFEKGKSMDSILSALADICTENQVPSLDVERITDWDQAKDSIIARVVNAERNEQLLEGRPHNTIDDLAVTYHVMLQQGPEGMASVAVTNDLIKGYGVSLDELHDTAMKNMETLSPSSFKSMQEVLAGMMGIEVSELQEQMPFPDDGPGMYVLTNESKLNGAAAILDTKKMDEIAEKLGGDFYVLPSSVHEVIILPMNDDPAQRLELEAMVHQVNATEVAAQDILSENVYAYDAADHELMRADRYEERQAEKLNEAVKDGDIITASDIVKNAGEKEKAEAPAKDTAENTKDPAPAKESAEKAPEKHDKPEKAKSSEKGTKERPSLKAKLDEKKAEVAKTPKKEVQKDRSKGKETSL